MAREPLGWKDDGQGKTVRTTNRRAAGSPPHDFTDKSRGVRLQKVLADAGVASRRDCEELITRGAVTVNGHLVADLPAWVDPLKDKVAVEGRPIPTAGVKRRGKRVAGASADGGVYVMLFKPRGVVSTNEDPEGRQRAIDLVKHPSKARLYPVGRLDIESSGLLLLTNDGELANRLTHPRYGVHKVYEVTVAGELDEPAVKKLEAGLFLTDRRKGAGGKTSKSRLKIIKRDRDRTRLLMELREGRNRQIRRMMADVGHKVRKLRRVQMGPLRLRGLQPGQWRDLTPKELIALRKAAFVDGERAAVAASSRGRKRRTRPD